MLINTDQCFLGRCNRLWIQLVPSNLFRCINHEKRSSEETVILYRENRSGETSTNQMEGKSFFTILACNKNSNGLLCFNHNMPGGACGEGGCFHCELLLVIVVGRTYHTVLTFCGKQVLGRGGGGRVSRSYPPSQQWRNTFLKVFWMFGIIRHPQDFRGRRQFPLFHFIYLIVKKLAVPTYWATSL